MTYRARKWVPYLERRFRLGTGGAVPDLDWDALESLNRTDFKRVDRVRELLLDGKEFDGSVYVLQGTSTYTVKLREYGSLFPLLLFLQRPRAYVDPQAFHPFVGPTGGPGFQDLPLLDTRSSGQFFVVVVQQTERDLTIYRRLYHGVRR